MTYQDLYEKAVFDLEQNKITLGEFEKRIKPLKAEINQWIPVSERLPERDGEYLVSTLGIIYGRTYTQVGEFSTATKSWIVYDSEYGYVPLYDVLAWMPLPEPASMEI